MTKSAENINVKNPKAVESVQAKFGKPGAEKYSKAKVENPRALEASELFSLFTADIIRQESLFTR